MTITFPLYQLTSYEEEQCILDSGAGHVWYLGWK